MPSLTDTKDEYISLFQACEVKEERKSLVNSVANRILQSRSRYELVAGATGVPWYLIAVIHCLESGMNFNTHLHNGDPLNARTVRVPPNRPLGNPPFSWETSATDALEFQGLSDWRDWSIEGSLYQLEAYNGWGYRRRRINSPYLWSFSNHYSKGKFTADGVFSPEAVSEQCGAAVLLKVLSAQGEIEFGALPPNNSQQQAPLYPGRILKKGEMNSPWVKLVQIRLNEVGCGPLVEDGDFGENTDSAVRLFQARSVDRNGEPLIIDGEVGSLTWEALFGQATVPGMDEISVESKLLKTAIEVARSQIGVKEVPLGANRGPEVDQYLRSVDLNPGYAWCAAFIYWCFDEAAKKLEVENPLIKTAGCLEHWNQAGREGIRRIAAERAIADPSLIQPGSIFIMDHGGGNGHTGIVEAVNGGKLVTIEGNTDDDSRREGNGVFKRTRKINSINKGFIDYSNT